GRGRFLAGLPNRSHFSFQARTEDCLRAPKVVEHLEIEPKLWRGLEVSRETQRRISRNRPRPVDDLVDPPRGHGDAVRQTVLADPERTQKLFEQHLARRDLFLATLNASCGSQRSRRHTQCPCPSGSKYAT